jgi:hypothetical protein
MQTVITPQNQPIEWPGIQEGVQVETNDLLLIRRGEREGSHRRRIIIIQVAAVHIHFPIRHSPVEGEDLQGSAFEQAIHEQSQGRSRGPGQIDPSCLIEDPA